MMRPLLSLFLLSALITGQSVSADMGHPTPPAHPMSSLVGDWDGTSEDGKVLRITYQPTSGGTALLETFAPEKEPTMTTLYHVDGRHLMMTHYCSIGNQPRMVTDLPKGEITRLAFGFLDATNLANPTDPHMHKMTLTLQDKDHMTQAWTLSKDGQEMTHTFTLARRK